MNERDIAIYRSSKSILPRALSGSGHNRFEAPLPTLWLWRLAFGNSSHEPFVSSTNWQLEIVPGTSGKSGVHASVAASASQVDTILRKVKTWVPAAELAGGTIRITDILIDLPSVGWSAGQVSVKAAAVRVPGLSRILRTSPDVLNNLNVSAGLGSPPPWEVKLRSDSLHLDSTIRISTNAAGLMVQSAGLWWTNRVVLDAQFGRSRLLPDNATLQAKDFHLPGNIFELKEYPEISGSVAAQWDGQQCSVDLNASALPALTETNLPPVKLDLHGAASTNSAVVHSADISVPWAQAKLARDLKLSFMSPFLQEPAAVTVHLDLAQQRWWKLQGLVDGEALLSPGEGKFPIARFRLSGSEVGDTHLKIASLKIEGNLTWPWLEVAQVAAAFDDGSTATVKGKVDLEKKEVLDGRLQANGNLARQWLPAGFSYGKLSLTGTVEGPFKELRHSGQLEVTNFISPELQPLQLQAAWEGKQMSLQRATALISAGASSMSVQGSLKIDGAGTNLTLSAFTLTTSNQNVLNLAAPATFSLTHGQMPTDQWIIQESSFDWRGTAGEVYARVAVNWPISGTVDAFIRNFRSATFDDFLTSRAEPFEIRSFKASGGWTNGPLSFSILGSAGMKPRKDLPLAAEINARADAHGITISNLVVSSQTSSVVVAHGFLPISFEPAAVTNRLRMDTQTPFDFTASTEPQSAFWEKVATWTELSLVAPNLRLAVSGTLQAPRGVINLQAAQIKSRKAAPNIPAFEDVDVAVQLDREIARVSRGQFL